eukprot:m.263418 g.263418  ORF g.263418 m.263418 type:complete len:698 (+) comp50370_c0_seq1:280-2373(+)
MGCCFSRSWTAPAKLKAEDNEQCSESSALLPTRHEKATDQHSDPCVVISTQSITLNHNQSKVRNTTPSVISNQTIDIQSLSPIDSNQPSNAVAECVHEKTKHLPMVIDHVDMSGSAVAGVLTSTPTTTPPIELQRDMGTRPIESLATVEIQTVTINATHTSTDLSQLIDVWELVFSFLRIPELVRFSRANWFTYKVSHSVRFFLTNYHRMNDSMVSAPKLQRSLSSSSIPGATPAIMATIANKSRSLFDGSINVDMWRTNMTHVRAWINIPFIIDVSLRQWQSTPNTATTTAPTTPITRAKGADDVDLMDYPQNVVVVKCVNKKSIKSLSGVGKLCTLILSDCYNLRSVEGFASVDCLDISGCKRLWDISPLAGVKKLVASGCFDIGEVNHMAAAQVLILNGCTSVVDVSGLGDVSTLDLSKTSVRDVSCLCHVRTLNLAATKVTDVSMLSHVHTLDISGCQLIKNVQGLEAVHTLVAASTNITDVQPLSSIHTLDLTNCRRLTDVGALANVTNLILKKCIRVTDVSALGNVTSLDLSYCPKIQDVSALGNVRELNLSGCISIGHDVSCLSNVRHLDLTGCKQVNQGFFALANATNLKLSLTGVCDEDLQHLASVETLFLRSTSVSRVGVLTNVKHLDLGHCTAVQSVRALTNLVSLNIRFCHAVTDWTELEPSLRNLCVVDGTVVRGSTAVFEDDY